MRKVKTVHVIGGGACGLFCAVELVKQGISTVLHEKTEECGKKLLVAGSSGLNITNNKPLDDFTAAYEPHTDFFSRLLLEYPPQRFREWLGALGIETFVGSSGKVFTADRGAVTLLSAIRAYLEKSPLCDIRTGSRFTGFSTEGCVRVNEEIVQGPVILCLGGASWPATGSTGDWVEAFKQAGILVTPFRACNCGFETSWSDMLRKQSLPFPVKNIAVRFKGLVSRGDISITEYGIEGSPVYFLSRELIHEIDLEGTAELFIDFFPDTDVRTIVDTWERQARKDSFSNRLRKAYSPLPGNKALMLECLAAQSVVGKSAISQSTLPIALKNLPLRLNAARPLEEAISSSGGVSFSELNESLALKRFPSVHLAGEMIDWDAPTGGYLLQACFSTSMRAVYSFLA